MKLLQALLEARLLFKFNGLLNFFAAAIAAFGKPINRRISGLILKDSKRLAKISPERVHL